MGSIDPRVLLNYALNGGQYLWNPPRDSWIISLANVFYILGLIVASPVIILIALDLASYAIVRTLGIENTHPVSSKFSESLHDTDPSSPHFLRHPSHVTLPPSQVLIQPETFFTTPGGGNMQLSGVGLFSPPGSRTPSPPTTRRSTLIRPEASKHSSRRSGFHSSDEEGDTMLLRRRKPDINIIVSSPVSPS